MNNEEEIIKSIDSKITNINKSIDTVRDELYKVELYNGILKDFITKNNHDLSSEFAMISQKIDKSIQVIKDKSFILEINKLKKIIKSNSGKFIEITPPDDSNTLKKLSSLEDMSPILERDGKSPIYIKMFKNSKKMSCSFDSYESFENDLQDLENEKFLENDEVYENDDDNKDNLKKMIIINKQNGSPMTITCDYIDNIDFNVNIFDNKKILCCLVVEIFKKNFDFESIGINLNSFKRFVFMVSNYYHNNPYHNFSHAVTVLQFIHLLTNKFNITKYLSVYEIFGLFVAALVHDIDHPGHTNLFEINNRSHLALKYNDKSVLENHHCSLAFYLIHQRNVQLLKDFDQVNFSIVRETIVECILSTDMKHHNDLIKGLEEKFYNGWDWTNIKDRILLVKTLIHLADLSNQVRPFEVSLQGSTALRNEFANQITKEEQLNLPTQEYMKLNSDKTFYNSEHYFSSNIVKPVWNILIELFPELEEFYKNLNENIAKWKELYNNC
jgi:hypothetical protein